MPLLDVGSEPHDEPRVLRKKIAGKSHAIIVCKISKSTSNLADSQHSISISKLPRLSSTSVAVRTVRTTNPGVCDESKCSKSPAHPMQLCHSCRPARANELHYRNQQQYFSMSLVRAAGRMFWKLCRLDRPLRSVGFNPRIHPTGSAKYAGRLKCADQDDGNACVQRFHGSVQHITVSGLYGGDPDQDCLPLPSMVWSKQSRQHRHEYESS